MARDPQDPNRSRWDNRPGELPRAEVVTPDRSGPFHARQLSPTSPLHIVARDGFSIIATIHSPKDAELASKMAAAEELHDTAAKLVEAQFVLSTLRGAIGGLARALEKARTPPTTK